jgi:DNA-binding XRE family transcriptional regulator
MPAWPFYRITLRARKHSFLPYPKNLETWGDHLKKRRLDLGLLQKDVARIIGADKTSVFNWENNLMAPSLRFIPKLIEFLGYRPGSEKKE